MSAETPNKVTLTAPKHIYLQVSDEREDCDEEFPTPTMEMTWCSDSVMACEVKYVRADLSSPTEQSAYEMGMTDNPPQEFIDYMVRNYPGPNTVICDPKWHAPKIWRAALHALRPEIAKGRD